MVKSLNRVSSTGIDSSGNNRPSNVSNLMRSWPNFKKLEIHIAVSAAIFVQHGVSAID